MGTFSDLKKKTGTFSSLKEQQEPSFWDSFWSRQTSVGPGAGTFQQMYESMSPEQQQEAWDIAAREGAKQMQSPLTKSVASFGSGFLDTASLGLYSRAQDKAAEAYQQTPASQMYQQAQQDMGYQMPSTLQDVKQLNPTASFLGSMAGYMAPVKQRMIKM